MDDTYWVYLTFVFFYLIFVWFFWIYTMWQIASEAMWMGWWITIGVIIFIGIMYVVFHIDGEWS